jgi:hypothetical protein
MFAGRGASPFRKAQVPELPHEPVVAAHERQVRANLPLIPDRDRKRLQGPRGSLQSVSRRMGLNCRRTTSARMSAVLNRLRSICFSTHTATLA